jgi:cytidyltransferase-like protein
MTIGCIHGRFQPFHNGHFEYLKAASERCDHLIVGITQYEPELIDVGSPAHRMNEADNPFTYWERVQIIKAAIGSSAFKAKTVDFVPFPIHSPELVRNFVNPSSVMFTTIYDEWNVRKIRRLKEQGYQICVLWRRKIKEIEGKQVRMAMREDHARFKMLVPRGVIETVDFIMRERQLLGTAGRSSLEKETLR